MDVIGREELMHNRMFRKGMNRVIVSFTTYPARISGISRMLNSLTKQTFTPDKIIMYLSEDQFNDKNLSEDLAYYFSKGLEIHWCQNDSG